MLMFGKLDEFLPMNENWAQYIERMDQFFIAIDIAEEPWKSHPIEFLWSSNI